MKNFTFYILHFTFCACMAQTAAWDSLRGGAHVVTNEQDTAAMARIVSATNALHEEISAVSGQAASAAALATNGIPETLAGHETRIGALEESAADRPDMSLYALRAEVPQAVDLAPYATTTDVLNRISASASATALQIETLRQNTATAIVASTNGLPEKIAAATNGIPVRIAAATNGLPERIASSTNALHTSLAPTISAASTALQPAATNNIPETLASHAGELARLSQALTANTESNKAYRLMSPEGDIYQDATGAVWHVAYATNPSPWYVTEIGYTNGTWVATNEIPGITSWSIEGGWDEQAHDGVWNLLVPSNGLVYASIMGVTDEEPDHLEFNLYGVEISVLEFGRSNIVTRSWTPVDQVLYASSGGGLTTNDVCNIVTNTTEASETFGPWTVDSIGPGYELGGYPTYEPDAGYWSIPLYDEATDDYIFDMAYASEDATVLNGDNVILVRTHTYIPSKNKLGLARLADLPPLTNGLASAQSVSAANSRAANAQSTANAASNVAANVEGTVTAWETYWDGDEVRVTVTNYDSQVHMPSLYIEQKLENTNAYSTVWDERTRWASNSVEMAKLRSAIDEKADRAWGYYESHTGNYAPDGYTWISSPKIAIAGGLAYQRTLTTGGAIWVLCSNGMVAQTGGDTNGFLRVKDDEGNTTFEIVRGNKAHVGAHAAGIKITSSGDFNDITIPYLVKSDEPPKLYGSTSPDGEWTQLTVDWISNVSGAYTGVVHNTTAPYFVKATYVRGGETYIKNKAPISVDGGILCTDGIHKVRPVYNNGSITWELVQ